MNKILRKLLQSETSVQAPTPKGYSSAEYLTLQNFYNNRALLPQGQSPSQLSGWLSQCHPRYNMSSWCFFGNITDEAGETAAINSIVQYQLLPNNSPYLAEWSYCDSKTNGYVIAPFLVEAGNVEYSRPLAITVDANPIYTGFLSLALVHGEIGQIGAKYSLTGRVRTEPDFDNWEYDLLMEDTFGVIQAGYGPTSFLPQWLFPNQTKEIMTNPQFDGSVHEYLKSGMDDMFGQGSYYYTLPLLKVDKFLIRKNGSSYFSGKKGNIWIDYVVQSFGEKSLEIVGSASWQFFAVQFPEIPGYFNYEAAIMVSIVEAKTGPNPDDESNLKAARFFISDPYHTQYNENGSMKAAFEWSINQIKYTGSDLYRGFPTKFEISLSATNGSISLKGEAIRQNQIVGGVNKYEGVFTVIADINFANGIQVAGVKGFAWAEVH
ncbi:hypothetical protein LEP1GSC050_1810 [Leptospira broomii serovar Hurstbridge str. 5399]|uniref:AttH domain-containing protein n=1 Tax=Leptospira broomii serovar Hurstbridge str. 5399 TaxID=1049789 RepID=T0GKL0_9LEPT|nr:hypothetical protein [Leptospira broomii]EQA47329.1 hypothetical protein LEP1GSC050_1810 [Leptospira broomii serovar Hurstbridge str. 5399]